MVLENEKGLGPSDQAVYRKLVDSFARTRPT